MLLTEQQKYLVQDLQSQEDLCVQKYTKYAEHAKDTELKNLFNDIKQQEQQHYNSLNQLLSGTVPAVNNCKSAPQYNPQATYTGASSPDKENDQFLCTDSISTEKYVSSAYNNDLFQFADQNVRKLLNDIQTEEQQHAEMIYKYKTVNG